MLEWHNVLMVANRRSKPSGMFLNTWIIISFMKCLVGNSSFNDLISWLSVLTFIERILSQIAFSFLTFQSLFQKKKTRLALPEYEYARSRWYEKWSIALQLWTTTENTVSGFFSLFNCANILTTGLCFKKILYNFSWLARTRMNCVRFGVRSGNVNQIEFLCWQTARQHVDFVYYCIQD